MRNILLSVVGTSPQVITETLYALHLENEWVDEVRVITTTKGKDKAVEFLLEKSQFVQMCKELNRPLPDFTADHIWVIPNSLGEPVSDARSESDHEALANFITTKVRDLTEDENVCVHASIAGGRKTMTFYLGYAMSLFGRRTDKMSHVLVTEGYENHPDFYYPREGSIVLRDRNTGIETSLDTSKAEVTLSYIPFIRQRDSLPKLLTCQKKPLDFKSLVDLINLAANPEKLKIVVSLKKRTISIFHIDEPDKAYASVKFSNGLEWCMYWLILEATKNLDNSYVRPRKIGKAEKSDCENFDAEHRSLAKAVLNQVCDFINIKQAKPGISVADYIDYILKYDETLENNNIAESSLNAMYHGLEGGQFDTLLYNIKKQLEEELPAELVKFLAPAPLFDKEGQYGHERKQNGGYAVNLLDPTQQIVFV